MSPAVSLDLMEFVEKNILPQYTAFDRAHNLTHAKRVIRHSVELAQSLGANVDMAYTVAAYHDLGMSGPRAVHHITSGKILVADARLRKWFTPDQINTMREAVEDHRASSSHAPRSLYGKIVAEADRDMEPQVVFRRTIQYGLSHYPEMDREQQWERFHEHMQSKYSAEGYIRLWLPNSPNVAYQKQLRDIIEQPTLLRTHFDRLYDEEMATSNE